MRSLPPPTARAILQAVAHEEETTVAALLGPAVGRTAKRKRREAILRLRAHRDGEDRAVWTVEEIAAWFGVARSTVSEAYRAEHGAYEGKAHRPLPDASGDQRVTRGMA